MMEQIVDIKELRNIWCSFSKEWKTVLKSNIFNWFSDEENKIFRKKYEMELCEEFKGYEPWCNYAYELTDSELSRLFRIKYLSTVICDASPWGGSEYTPELDLRLLSYFRDLTYLDLSCCSICCDWVKIINETPIMSNVTDLRIVCDDIHNLDFIKVKFPNIRRLDCSANKITTLKPLDGLKIVELSCSENPIPSDEIWDFLGNNPLCSIKQLKGIDTFELNK